MYEPTKPYKEKVLKLIKKTWKTPFLSVKNNVVKKNFCHPEYHHSDGIGTKGIYHWQKKTFKNAVQDALAMNLNDLLLMNANPYAILNHLFLPKDDRKAVLQIINHLSKECQRRKISILGGETAIHDDMNGMELSVTMQGFIEKPKVNKFKIGDVLIGLRSNGLHSNGFTKVREIFGKKYLSDFNKPTFIYFETIMNLMKIFKINGMCHITGGAFTKIKDFLRKANAEIKRNHKLKPQKIFRELYKKGVSDKEMYKTFNCGIGFILSARPQDAKKIISEIKGFKVDMIGKIIPGNGKVIIESSFSNKKIIF